MWTWIELVSLESQPPWNVTIGETRIRMGLQTSTRTKDMPKEIEWAFELECPPSPKHRVKCSTPSEIVNACVIGTYDFILRPVIGA